MGTHLLSNQNKKDFWVKLVLWWVALSVQWKWLIQLTGTVETAINLLKKAGQPTHIWRRVDPSRPPFPIPTQSGWAWEPDTSINQIQPRADRLNRSLSYMTISKLVFSATLKQRSSCLNENSVFSLFPPTSSLPPTLPCPSFSYAVTSTEAQYQ